MIELISRLIQHNEATEVIAQCTATQILQALQCSKVIICSWHSDVHVQGFAPSDDFSRLKPLIAHIRDRLASHQMGTTSTPETATTVFWRIDSINTILSDIPIETLVTNSQGLPSAELLTWLQQHNIEACLTLSIDIDDAPIGCIMALQSTPRQWCDTDITLMQQGAVHMAIAIQQAALQARIRHLESAQHLTAHPSNSPQPKQQQSVLNSSSPDPDIHNLPKLHCDLMRVLSEDMHGIFWQWNEQSYYTYISPDVFEILGYHPEDMIGKRPTNFMMFDEAERVKPILQDINARPAPILGMETTFRHKDGYSVVIETYAVPVYDKNKTFRGYFGIDRNISIHKRAEQETQLLLKILQELTVAPTLEAALSITIREVCQATGWMLGQAWVPNGDNTALAYASDAEFRKHSSIRGHPSDRLLQFRQQTQATTFRKGEGLVGRVWDTHESEWIPDITKAGSRFVRVQEAKACGLRASFAVPIRVHHYDDLTQPSDNQAKKEKVLAVLAFFMAHPRERDQHLVQIVSAVAAQLGTVMQLKRAEADLRTREKQFRLIFEHAPIGMNMLDAEGRFFQVNRAFCTLLGYSREELIGQRCADLTHPEDDSLAGEIWERFVASTRSHIQMEKKYLTKDGQSLHVLISLAAIREATGKARYFICQTLNISQQKQMEEALFQQAREEWFARTMLQRIRQTLNLEDILRTTVHEIRQFLDVDRVIIYQFQPDGSGFVNYESVASAELAILHQWIHDPCFTAHSSERLRQGQCMAIANIEEADLTECYREMLEQFQIKAVLVVPLILDHTLWGLLLVHHCTDPRIWPPSQVDLMKQIANQLAIAIHQSELYTQVHQLKDNLEEQVRDRTHQIIDLLTFEAVLRRITTKIRETLDEEQILQVAVQELKTALAITSCDTAIFDEQYQTSTVCFECSEEPYTLQGKSVAMEEFDDLFPQLSRGECIQFCEMMVRPSFVGTERRSVLACPIRDERNLLGDIWLFRLPDKTFDEMEIQLAKQVADQCAIAIRQSRLYHEAQAQVKELERVNRLKDDFLSTVSHELRTPMASIKVAADMLERLLNQGIASDNNSNRIQQYLHILRYECNREINLIDDLLDLSRLDADTEPLLVSEHNLQTWLPYITQMFEDRTAQQQQQLYLQIPPDLPPVKTDYSYLERIISELLHNACKYTPSGESIVVAVHWHRSADTVPLPMVVNAAPSGYLELSINNSGIEISPEECDRIFDKFYRIPNADPWKHGGTGLGLALVKKLTEQINGTIWLESSNGWARFKIRLPFQI